MRALLDSHEDLKREIELLRASNSESNEMLHRKVMDYNSLKHTDNLMISSKNQEILSMSNKLHQQSSESRELKDIIRNHIAEIATLQQEVSTLRDRCTKAEQLTEELEKIMTMKDQLIAMHSNAADDCLTFQFTSLSKSTQGQEQQQQPSYSSSVRFEEFLLLKKENKELKLRLADVNHEPRPATVNLDNVFSNEQPPQQRARTSMLTSNFTNNKSPSKLPNRLRKSVTNRRY